MSTVDVVDVVVIGGGVIGCAIARDLARRNARVTLIERRAVGAEASGAAAGTLGAQAECDQPGPLLDLALASRRLFPALLDAVRDETGIPCEPGGGVLYCALSDEDERVLEERRRWQAELGLRVERLGRDDVLALEHCLTPETRWALHYPDDQWLDPRGLTIALGTAAERAGVRMLAGTTAVRVTSVGDRVTGVACGAESITSAAVVNAAGSWAGLIELPSCSAAPPVFPVRGQMVAVGAPAARPHHALYSTDGYIVPRVQGPIVAGSTYEQVGYDKRVTAGGLARVLASAVRLLPELEGLPVVETWAGLRPVTPDRLPVLGAASGLRGLYHATGHGRNGILLAPITGRLMAELVLEGRTSVALEPFAPTRFD
jgi:glycine oxidase